MEAGWVVVSCRGELVGIVVVVESGNSIGVFNLDAGCCGGGRGGREEGECSNCGGHGSVYIGSGSRRGGRERGREGGATGGGGGGEGRVGTIANPEKSPNTAAIYCTSEKGAVRAAASVVKELIFRNCL